MFQSDHSPDLPAGIIAELGIDPAAVRETIEDARAIRCPERPAVYPERSFAGLAPEPASAGLAPEPASAGLGEAAAPWDPASALPPA